MRKHKFTLVLILLPILLLPVIVFGRPFRVASLPDNGNNFGCGTCHTNPAGGGARNAFGTDWAAIAIPNGDQYVPQLASKDSDGDGATNDEEFNANTHPGDPNSKPPKPNAVRAKGKIPSFWGKIKSKGY